MFWTIIINKKGNALVVRYIIDHNYSKRYELLLKLVVVIKLVNDWSTWNYKSALPRGETRRRWLVKSRPLTLIYLQEYIKQQFASIYSKYKSIIMMDWLKYQNINVLFWPYHFPDINTIENIEDHTTKLDVKIWTTIIKHKWCYSYIVLMLN